MRQNKKAFEIQFNWIFVLIAGALILLFFTVIVSKQRTISQSSTNAAVLKSVDSLINTASVSKDTTKVQPIIDSDIKIECNRVEVGGIAKQYQNLILFGPSSLKGDKLIWQTMEFWLPYKSTNLVYMSNPKIRYIIIGDTDIAKEIEKLLPPSPILEKERIPTPSGNVYDKKNYKTRFIFFGTPPDSSVLTNIKSPDNDVSAISVGAEVSGVTKIDFYQKNRDTFVLPRTSYSVSNASLLAAIYSDNLETYECGMRNAFARLSLVTEIYKARVNKIKTEITAEQRTKCNNFYDSAVNAANGPLTIIGTSASTLKDAQSFGSSSSPSAPIQNIAANAKSLSNINKQLQENSCPVIY